MENVNNLTLMINEEYKKIGYLSFEDYPIIKQVNKNCVFLIKPLLKNKNKTTLSLYATWKNSYDIYLLDTNPKDLYSISYNWHNNTYDSIYSVIVAMKEDYETNKKIF